MPRRLANFIRTRAAAHSHFDFRVLHKSGVLPNLCAKAPRDRSLDDKNFTFMICVCKQSGDFRRVPLTVFRSGVCYPSLPRGVARERENTRGCSMIVGLRLVDESHRSPIAVYKLDFTPIRFMPWLRSSTFMTYKGLSRRATCTRGADRDTLTSVTWPLS